MTTIRLALSLFASVIPLIAQAPLPTRILPEVFGPGDTIVIEGTHLGTTTAVGFVAEVGGTVGQRRLDVAPSSVSPTRLEVTVPTFGVFAPSTDPNPGTPSGSVVVVAADGSASAGLPGFFTEGTSGTLATAGQGSSQASGIGRPNISFDTTLPAPAPGEFALVTCLNAEPGSATLLALGLPSAAPTPFSNGLVAIDLASPMVFLGPVLADLNGEAAMLVDIPGPGPIGLTFAAQWVVFDPTTADAAITNALLMTL